MSNKSLIHRFSRLRGQLEKLQTSIEVDQPCSDVIPQFLAVRGAFTAAFEVYIKEALQDCPLDDEAKREQLIAMLIRS